MYQFETKSLLLLFEALQQKGYTIVAPVVAQEAITWQVVSAFEEIAGVLQ